MFTFAVFLSPLLNIVLLYILWTIRIDNNETSLKSITVKGKDYPDSIGMSYSIPDDANVTSAIFTRPDRHIEHHFSTSIFVQKGEVLLFQLDSNTNTISVWKRILEENADYIFEKEEPANGDEKLP